MLAELMRYEAQAAFDPEAGPSIRRLAIDFGQRLWSMPLLEERRHGLVSEPEELEQPIPRMTAPRPRWKRKGLPSSRQWWLRSL